MPAFVKGKRGEAKWAKAKRAAKHAGAKNQYAFANWWFHHKKSKGRKRRHPVMLKPYKGK